MHTQAHTCPCMGTHTGAHSKHRAGGPRGPLFSTEGCTGGPDDVNTFSPRVPFSPRSPWRPWRGRRRRPAPQRVNPAPLCGRAERPQMDRPLRWRPVSQGSPSSPGPGSRARPLREGEDSSWGPPDTDLSTPCPGTQLAEGRDTASDADPLPPEPEHGIRDLSPTLNPRLQTP